LGRRRCHVTKDQRRRHVSTVRNVRVYTCKRSQNFTTARTDVGGNGWRKSLPDIKNLWRVEIYRVIQIKVNQFVYGSVHMIINLPTKPI